MDIFLLLFAFLLLIFGMLFGIYFFYAVFLSKNFQYPPAFPSFGNMRKQALLEAETFLSSADKSLKVIDLGCCIGGLLVPLAKKFPNCQFVGYDWDFFVVKIARWRCRKLKNVSIVHANFLQADLSSYDLILGFLGVKASQDLSLILQEKFKPKAKLISLAFEVPGLKCDKVIDATSYGMPLKVYVYHNGNNL